MNWITILLVATGLGVALAGCLWLFATAFQDSFWWGIGSLLVPGVLIVFLVYKWPAGKAPLLTTLVGVMALVGSYPMMRAAPGGTLDSKGLRGRVAALLERDAARGLTPSEVEHRRAALVRREAELRRRKQELDPRDARALARLSLQIQAYNRDLAAFRAEAERLQQRDTELAAAPRLPRTGPGLLWNETLR